VDSSQLPAILLTALLTLVVTILAQRYLEKKAALKYRIRSSGDLVPTNANVPLDISYGGARVDHLTQLQVEFENTGNMPIEKDAHHVRVTWKVPKGNLIEHVADGEKLEMTSYSDEEGEHVVADIVLLNPHERSELDFLIAGEADPTIEISARGVGVVGRLDIPSRFRPHAAWIGILGGFVVAIAFGLALLDQIQALIREFGTAAILFLAVATVSIYAMSITLSITLMDRRR
jgi:hypothetical protein